MTDSTEFDLAPSTILISVPELAAAIDQQSHGSGSLYLLDVRWQLGDPDGHQHYVAGHIPGAVYVDLDQTLAGAPSPQRGRHPLPDAADLERHARAWGLRNGGTVVVYDANGSLAAARAWWLLRAAGVPDVRILDGALPAWVRAGLPLQAGAIEPEPGDITVAREWLLPTIDIDRAAGFAGEGVLLDARARERYLGLTEPIEPRAGHIPGARSAPTSENIASDGRFLEPAALRARFAGLGVTRDRPVATYCGSGVTGSHQVVALALAGFTAALYPGSFSQWANSDRPVETADEGPHGDGHVSGA